MQWDKLGKTGKLPHLWRWFTFVSANPVLRSVEEEFLASSRRKAAADSQKEVAAGGRGGGGTLLLCLLLYLLAGRGVRSIALSTQKRESGGGPCGESMEKVWEGMWCGECFGCCV